jgi:hypothetical protein
MSLRCTALYLTVDVTPPAPSSRGPQVIFIMALLLCVGGSLDLARFLLGMM